MLKSASITTTIRNPQRISDLSEILNEFSGEILNDNTIELIYDKMINTKFTNPTSETLKSVNEIANANKISFMNAYRLYELGKSTPRNYKGWDKGLNSRFFTYIEVFLLLGFADLSQNKEIKFHVNIEKFLNDDTYRGFCYTNSFAKYQTNNPYKSPKLKNKVNILPLMLRTIEYFGFILDEEISFLCCMKNNDEIILFDYIRKYRLFKSIINFNKSLNKAQKQIRIKNYIYRTCLGMLEIENSNSYYKCNNKISNECTNFKFKTLLTENPDDIKRKLMHTSLFYEDINNKIVIEDSYLELSKYIIKKYLKNIDFNNDIDKYSTYLSQTDYRIRELFHPPEEKDYKLKEWYDLIGEKEILKSLSKINNKEEVKHKYLKYTSHPILLEFLTSLLLWREYHNSYEVKPNYKINKEGFPKFTAPAGVPDICVESAKQNVEVTLMRGRDQLTNEIPSIFRHASNMGFKKSIFVAPRIHEDSKLFIEFLFEKKDFNMKPITLTELIEGKGKILV